MHTFVVSFVNINMNVKLTLSLKRMATSIYINIYLSMITSSNLQLLLGVTTS